jgi:hypothetical protein
MQIFTFRGEVSTPESINTEFHQTGALALIAQHLELEGAKPISRSLNHFSFRGVFGARFATFIPLWRSIIFLISSGEVNVFARDEKVVVSYKICFDEWALSVLLLFAIIWLAAINNSSHFLNGICFTQFLGLAICFFGAGSFITVVRFRRMLHLSLRETNQLLGNPEPQASKISR